MAAVEVLAATFAGISALKDATDLWSVTRDKIKAFGEYTSRLTSYAPQSRNAAITLNASIKSISDEKVLDIFTGRVDTCSKRLADVLGGNYPDDIIDGAIVEYKQCVCRELNRVKSVMGMPPDWQQKWDDYQCGARALPRI